MSSLRRKSFETASTKSKQGELLLESVRKSFPEAVFRSSPPADLDSPLVTGPACLELPFQTVFLEVLILVLDVGGSFPELPPKVFLKAFKTRYHRLLNSKTGEVAVPKLDPVSWNVHCDLGRVLREFLVEFSANPPLLSAEGVASASASYSPSASISPSFFASDSPMIGRDSGKSDEKDSVREMLKMSVPKIPSKFETIEAMSVPELKEFLSNDIVFEKFVSETEIFKILKGIKTDLSSEVLKLARENLSKKDEVVALRDSVAEMSNKLSETAEKYSHLSARQQVMLGKFSVESLASLLDEAAGLKHSESEKIKTAFLEKDGVDSAAFLKQYVEKRKEYHLMSVKRDRLLHFK